MDSNRSFVLGGTIVGSLCLTISVLYIIIESFVPLLSNLHALTVLHSALICLCIVFIVGLQMKVPAMVISFLLTCSIAIVANCGGFLRERGLRMIMNGLAIFFYSLGLILAALYYHNARKNKRMRQSIPIKREEPPRQPDMTITYTVQDSE